MATDDSTGRRAGDAERAHLWSCARVTSSRQHPPPPGNAVLDRRKTRTRRQCTSSGVYKNSMQRISPSDPTSLTTCPPPLPAAPASPTYTSLTTMSGIPTYDALVVPDHVETILITGAGGESGWCVTPLRGSEPPARRFTLGGDLKNLSTTMLPTFPPTNHPTPPADTPQALSAKNSRASSSSVQRLKSSRPTLSSRQSSRATRPA